MFSHILRLQISNWLISGKMVWICRKAIFCRFWRQTKVLRWTYHQKAVSEVITILRLTLLVSRFHKTVQKLTFETLTNQKYRFSTNPHHLTRNKLLWYMQPKNMTKHSIGNIHIPLKCARTWYSLLVSRLRTCKKKGGREVIICEVFVVRWVLRRLQYAN